MLKTPRGGTVRPPTIHDVAALCGVSKSTVSNVMRNAPNVSAETRDRVLAAMGTLGYRPNGVARNLASQHTNLIGVVVGNLANEFAGELVRRIAGEAFSHDYTTLLAPTDGDPAMEVSAIDALLEQRVAALVMVQYSGDYSVVTQLLRERIPVVTASCWSMYTDAVAVDDVMGLDLAVSHLTGLGHREFAMVDDSTIEASTGQARRHAFERALVSHGIAPPTSDRTLTWPADLDISERMASLGPMLESPNPPTAVVCTNDYTAIRVMESAENLGFTVPDDLSIVGFDGIDIGGHRRIGLTTIAQPTQQIARTAVDQLLRRLSGDLSGPPAQVRLPPELVVRRSTAPPRSLPGT